jgi:hypothetical protein
MISGANFNMGRNQEEFQFLVIEKLEIKYQNISAPYVVELQFGLINFLFFGSTLHPRLYGKQFRFNLTDRYSVIQSALSASKAELSAIVSVSCNASEIREMFNRIHDIAILLSFVNGTWVSVAYVDTIWNRAVVSTQVFAVRVYDYYDKESLIDVVRQPTDLNAFLTNATGPYTDLRGKLLLNFALEYCILAKSASAVAQIEYLTLFVALESLVNRLQNHIPHAKSSSRLKSLFVCLSNCLLCISGKRRKPKFLILKRLRDALDHYELRDYGGVTQLMPSDGSPNYETIRNDLAHRGDFPSEIDSHSCVMNLLDTFQRLLLAILQYRGNYVDCSRDFQTRMID